jgi:prepilin-type processing-associated H-X9-DG protein
VIAISGVRVAVLLPAIQAAREGSRNASCKNNLRQIALAVHHYHDVAKRLPPARLNYSATAFIEPGPFFVVLPYLEERSTAELYDVRSGYQSSAGNASVSNTRLAIYLCPTMNLPREVPDPNPDCDETGAPGSYAACTGSTLSFAPNLPSALNPTPHNGAIIHPKYGPTTIDRISNADGTSQTLLLGEMNYGLKNYFWSGSCKPANTVRWGVTRWALGYPGVTWGSTLIGLNHDTIETYVSGGFPAEYEAFRSDHTGGVNFSFVDGSVRFITDSIDLATLQALATRDGHERVDKID